MIPWAAPVFWGNERRYVADALDSTWISGGPYVERLEREVSALCGGRHALTASNGTTALHMAYAALGLGAGDEVVVPGFAFLAAANVALHVGARPVFCEVDRRTWCMTAADVVPCLSERTRLIVAVHTYGNVCDMDEICALGRSRGIPVLEDAAEAFASRYKGRPAGTVASIGSFSFQATKTITTGEGGMVVTDDEALAKRMRLYRSHGMDRSRTYYWHEVAGHNFRLTNLQAALGCAQLEHLERIALERKRVHGAYRRRFAGFDGGVAQHFAAEVDPVLWAFALRLDANAYPQGRDAVIQQMTEKGIETRPGFYPPGRMGHLYQDCPPLPVCEELASQVISLPTYPALQDKELDQICEAMTGLRR